MDSGAHPASSMKTYEKWPESNAESIPRALVRQPAVNKVHIITRYLYMHSKDGNVNFPPPKLQIGLILSLNDF